MYAKLVQLDWIDFVEIGPYQVQAFGLTAYIKKGTYEFTISENMKNKQLYVHERFVEPKVCTTKWVEVYRTNRLLRNTHFITELSWLEKEIEKLADNLPKPDTDQII